MAPSPRNEALLDAIAAGIVRLRGEGTEDPAAPAGWPNEAGLVSRTGRPWTAASLARFLASPGARRLGLRPLRSSGTLL